MVLDKVRKQLNHCNEEIKKDKTIEQSRYKDVQIKSLERQITQMEAVSNVIKKRKEREATSEHIGNYKKHLIENVWKNNETMKQHIAEIQ